MLQSISLFIVAAFNLGLGLFVWSRQPKSAAHQSFCALFGSVALWAVGVGAYRMAPNPEQALWWVRVCFAGAYFGPVSLYLFMLTFPDRKIKFNTWLIAGSVLTIIPLILFTGIMVKQAVRYSWGYGFLYGPLHKWFSLYLFVLVGASLVQLARKGRGLKNDTERDQYIYLILGMAIPTIIATVTNVVFPLMGTSQYSFIGPLTSALMGVFLAIAILKYHLLDIRVMIKRSVVYSLMVAFMVGLSSLILFILGLFIAGGRNTFLATVFQIMAMATTYRPMEKQFSRWTDHLFFMGEYDYRLALQKATHEMASNLQLEHLLDIVVHRITKEMRTEKACIFLRKPGGYYCETCQSLNARLVPNVAHLPRRHAAIRVFEVASRSLHKARVELDLQRTQPSHPLYKEKKQIAELFTRLNLVLMIPLVSNQQLIGILGIGERLSGDVFSSEDIQLLETLAAQAAVSIEHARLYPEIQQKEEELKLLSVQLQRTDKLSAMGTLAAGIAHEIKNPLTSMRLFVQTAQRRKDIEPDFWEKNVDILLHELDHLTTLTEEFMDFARSSAVKFEAISLQEAIEKVTRLIRAQASEKHVEIETRIPDGLKIHGDKQRMGQVFLNLTLNAVQAMPPDRRDGKIVITAARNANNQIGIEIRDNGSGIPAEHLDKLFTPFYTTKETGTGLGLSLVKKYIEAHHGRINVSSQLGEGTAFMIEMAAA